MRGKCLPKSFAHIYDTGWNPASTTSWTASGVQLYGPHLEPVENHTELPGIPPAPVLTFVDYEKVFDSVETNAVLSALVDRSVDLSYVRTLTISYDSIQLFHRSLIIPSGKGLQKGDSLSPKLFTAALEWKAKSLSWEEKTIREEGTNPNNLPSADGTLSFREVSVKQ
ncbi:hypothetical protein RB195_016921 [Necator americanus]|uniref:Reverse transcriptase domain-containing protein n=1 Tax=Necator americanus TaxID=51031 RepID=A0ABR1C4Y5_NECAM